MCMVEDGDPAEVARTKIVTARKIHTCEECGRTIATGERYRYTFMVYDGWPSSVHACAHCMVAQAWLVENCGGYCWGAVREDLLEHCEEYPDLADEFRVLTDGMASKWTARGSLMPLPRRPSDIRVLIEATA